MATLTVFTPAYNRAHTLPRTYESLLRQSCKDFVWLIVDDGSSDNTAELVRQWQASDNGFEIRYIYKENGGMHTAHNTAYENIDTELNICIDSDDCMSIGAVEKILVKWRQVKDQGYAGIIALDADMNGSVIGKGFPKGLRETTLTGYYAAGGSGDKKLIYRTNVIRKYPPYPVFEGEKYVALAYKYRLIDQDYSLAVLDEVVCNVDYQPDGHSTGMWKEYVRSPKGFAFWRKVCMQYPESKKRLVIDCIHYVSSSLIAGNRKFIAESPRKLLTVLCVIPGCILSIITKKHIGVDTKMNVDRIFADRQISIIVPVYNVERVLGKCVRSIQEQTHTNWKLLLVDDGSTDRSGTMCDEYAKQDSRILAVHTSNGGPHAARMKGLELVPDDSYCCFCDSDDVIPKDALQKLVANAVQTGADLVCGNMQRIYKGAKFSTQKLACFSEPRVYSRNEITGNLFLCCFGGGRFPVNLVAKLYKTNILKTAIASISVHPKCFAEDLNVTMHVLPLLESLSVVDDIVYYYRMGGGTSKFMPTFLDDNILMYQLKMQQANKCTSSENVEKLIGIELKNIIVSYWIMCEKNRRYPQGSLLNEVKAVCELPEVEEALTMLDGDRSGLPGVNKALINRDYDTICELIRQKVKRDRPKDILKKMLMG